MNSQVQIKTQNTSLSKKVKLNFVYPEQLESKFVNHLIVQNQPDCFTLSFFETILPTILGESEEERKTVFEKLNTINAKCVAGFIITPEKMPGFISVMQESLKNHQDIIALEKKKKQGG